MTRFTRRDFLGSAAAAAGVALAPAFPARAAAAAASGAAAGAAKGTLRLGVASYLDAEVLARSDAGHGEDARGDVA